MFILLGLQGGLLLGASVQGLGGGEVSASCSFFEILEAAPLS